MVPSESEVRSLLRLLDDDHPVVRAAVKERLAILGEAFDRALDQLPPGVADEFLPAARQVRRELREDGFRELWGQWLRSPSGPAKVEEGLLLVAQFFPLPDWDETRIRKSLDGLAKGFLLIHPRPDFRDLALYLFGSGRFLGNEEDYYGPENSNLAWILRDRRGNPILLACLMMLVARRAGLEVGGCNYPAHFLARHESPEAGGLFLIDCFNEGRILPARTLIKHHPFASRNVEEVVRAPATAETILSRVLRNLDHALYRVGRPEDQRFVRGLWREMSGGGHS